ARWHRSCLLTARTFSGVGPALTPYASATVSATKVPAHAGPGSSEHSAVGPSLSRRYLQRTWLVAARRSVRASTRLVHCASACAATESNASVSTHIGRLRGASRRKDVGRPLLR